MLVKLEIERNLQDHSPRLHLHHLSTSHNAPSIRQAGSHFSPPFVDDSQVEATAWFNANMLSMNPGHHIQPYIASLEPIMFTQRATDGWTDVSMSTIACQSNGCLTIPLSFA